MRPNEFKQMKERAGEVEDEARQIGEEGKPAKKSKKSKKKKEKVGEPCKE